MLPSELTFLVCQVGIADRSDEAPVPADRAALDPGDAEIEGLELHTGNPDRGEEMAAPAAYDCVASELVAEAPSRERGGGDGADHDRDGAWPAAWLLRLRHRAPGYANVLIYKNVSRFAIAV